MEYVGGCQCGATRYRAAGPRGPSSVCYCRMCQKAAGAPLMTFIRFPADQIAWSTPPAIFASSNRVERGFCASCGTPLSYQQIGSPNLSLTLYSLDDPSAVPPEVSFCTEGRPAWCLGLADIPHEPGDLPGLVSYQR